MTIASFINQPNNLYDPDTWIYVAVANQVATGHLIDKVRTPGYPLFLVLMTRVARLRDLPSVSVAQGALFVVSAVGVYALAALIARRLWMALIAALPVASNVMLVSFARPILSEGQALFLLVCLGLTIVWYVRAKDVRLVWLALGLLFALGMTKPEWLYCSAPFAVFLALVARWHGTLRRALPHLGAALLVFVALCGLYFYGNARHGYAGFGANQNVNLLGKVMQYHMQHEAPAEYAVITREIDATVALGDYDPWHVVAPDPTLVAQSYVLAAKYSWAVILHHPVEYAMDTARLLPTVILDTGVHQPGLTNGPFGQALAALLNADRALQYSLLLLPLVALFWWLRFLRRRHVGEMTVIMSGLALLCVYSLAINALFSYAEYLRLQTPVDPLMVVVVWLSLIVALTAGWTRLASTLDARRQSVESRRSDTSG